MNDAKNRGQALPFSEMERWSGSVAKFRNLVALPGASSEVSHFPEPQSGLKS